MITVPTKTTLWLKIKSFFKQQNLVKIGNQTVIVKNGKVAIK